MAVSVVNTIGKTSRESEIALLEDIKASQFLFGRDVRRYLDQMWERFLKLNAANIMLDASGEPGQKNHIRAQVKLFREITQFYYEGADVFAPYMRMDHRLTRPIKKPHQRPRAQNSRIDGA